MAYNFSTTVLCGKGYNGRKLPFKFSRINFLSQTRMVTLQDAVDMTYDSWTERQPIVWGFGNFVSREYLRRLYFKSGFVF